MSLVAKLARLFGRAKALAPRAAPAADETSASPPPAVDAALRIASAIADRRWGDALEILVALRESPDEPVAIEAAMGAFGPAPDADEVARPLADPLLDEIHLRIAESLVARGARARGAAWLARASSAALVVRADLLVEGVHEGAPTRDELDLAMALLARALRMDIDAPGARDRFERLRTRLGGAEDATPATVGATLIAKGGPTLPFVLEREVARGGAGVVYRARESLGSAGSRVVALKMIHDRSGSRAQLAHEARIAIRFRGPGVVPIFDVDPDAGWLSMAWAAGGSLRHHLQRGGAGAADDPLVRAVGAWLTTILATLADVHRAGWVHGDVKPANILFDAAGAPWLGDFGLARQVGAPNTPGSARYVSRARAGGAPCAPPDDVFGAGRLIEDVLAAGWPDDAHGTLRAIARDAREEAPPEITDLLARLGELGR